jgi:hypothetical protein
MTSTPTSSAVTSNNTFSALNSAATLLLQQQFQGTGSAVGLGNAQALLKQQEVQLRATRMLLQQRQLEGLQSLAAGGHRGLFAAASANRGNLLGNLSGGGADSYSALAAQSMSNAKAAVEATAGAATSAEKKEAEETPKEAKEEEEQTSDEEYFKAFALKQATGGDETGSTDAADSDDGKAGNESFPHKLYRMLFEASQEDNEDIVSFLPSGKGFVINDTQKFVSTVMPR